jgi:hypothetical protein
MYPSITFFYYFYILYELIPSISCDVLDQDIFFWLLQIQRRIICVVPQFVTSIMFTLLSKNHPHITEKLTR